jgi:hypothetical protein
LGRDQGREGEHDGAGGSGLLKNKGQGHKAEKEEKDFFFEKKKQKTFAPAPCHPAQLASACP